MEAIVMKTYKCILRTAVPLLCLIILMVSGGPHQADAATSNGVIRQVGSQQVLNLWGSNYDMGYAHGYLLADKIRDLVDHYMISTVTRGVIAYNALLASDASEYQWQTQYLDEIKGMAAGMVASGKSLYVQSLGRNIDSRDIRALNLQEQFYFGCSSFGAWGNATASGETLVARNLDFYYDSQGNNANYQLIIAYEPTGKTNFISFAWPGAVGVYSGMNANGITVMANTGNLTNPYSGPFHPVTEVYRTILEATTTSNFLYQPLSIIKYFHENPPEIIQIGTRYQGSGDPVYYIEQSHDLDLIRYPADGSYDHIIATNHFLNVIPPPTSGESLSRYNTIRNGLISLYGSGDRKVDSTEAWNLLSKVANVVAPTLTSGVIRPNRMEFDLSFARMVNGVFTAATALTPQTYAWASLFPDHTALPVALSSLALYPTSVVGGAASQGTVTLTAPAPTGGVVVTLSDNSSAVSVPGSVTVASGGTGATFTIATTRVYNTQNVIISARYGEVTKTATLTVRRR